MKSGAVDSNPTHPTQSELWFEDGNLVFQAENTQFRIHRSIICASSTVFKEMFGLSQLVPGDELVEGCPVVHLLDSAVELQHVLKAIYDRQYRCDVMDPASLPIVSAFLRLGKKYEITPLYDEAMKLLRQCCPSTLEALDKNLLFPQPVQYVQVINLALETGILSLLPAALSILLTMSSLSSIAGGLSTVADTYFLRHEGLKMLCLGRDRLRKTVLRNVNPACPNKAFCQATLLELLKESEKMDTIFTLIPCPWQDYLRRNFCAMCVEDVRKRWNDRRRSAWNELPSYYGLPPWGELLSSP